MKVLVLMGATATGKSSMALELAEKFGREIVSADSRQIYRGLRIGTAQPSEDERSRVAHHLVDFLSPNETWSAQHFTEATLRLIRNRQAAPPILVGGTGFWLRSLMEGLFPLAISRETTLAARAALEPLATDDLFARLKRSDPESADRIHPNDRQRILRALEVLDATGTTLSEHHRQGRNKPQGIEWIRVVLTRPRSDLHTRIEARLTAMLEGGWPEEVRGLLNAGVDPEAPGMLALGYPEIIAMLDGGMTREDALERILFRTRQYARRQEIWFRREEAAKILDAGDDSASRKLMELLES